MPTRRWQRYALLAAVTGGCLAGAVYAVGVDTIVGTMARMHLRSTSLAFLLILLNTGLVFCRFRSVLKGFGYRPHLRDALVAFTVGQVSNQVLLNIVGQSLTRAAVLRTTGVPLGVSVVGTYLERLVAAGLLFAFSLIGALVLFLDIGPDLDAGGAYLLSLTAGIAVTTAVVSAFFLRNAAFRHKLNVGVPRMLRFWPAALLTVAAQASMLSAYVVLVLDLDLQQMSAAILAALTIVMFCASLPISFSGWGVRELSAAQALAVVGIGSSVAVSSAVIIGLLGLFVAVGGGMLGLYLYARSRSFRAASARVRATPPVVVDHDRWLGVAAAGAAGVSAVLLFFQIRVSTGGSEVTVNAADLLALTGLGLILLRAWSRRSLAPLPNWLVGAMAAISLLLLYSLSLGYLYFGSNTWALVNRGFGWLVIAGYVSLGAMIALVPQRALVRQLLAAFILAGVTIAAEQLLLLVYSLFIGSIPGDAFTSPLRGYAANSNAFAFQMVMTATCVMAASRIPSAGLRPWLCNGALAILFAAVFYSHSRAGLAMMALLLIVAVAVPTPEGRRRAATSAAFVGLVFAILVLVPTLFSALSAVFPVEHHAGMYLSQQIISADQISRASSDSDRWRTIIQGWDLWLDRPLFGNGLGAFVQSRLVAGKPFEVIHSIPVWLLAETGLFGLLTVAAIVIVVIGKALSMLRNQETTAWGFGLIAILGCLAGAGLVHDFFFQRCFWFMFGLFVAAAAVQERRVALPAGRDAVAVATPDLRPAVDAGVPAVNPVPSSASR